jgi:heat shock protein 5
MICETHVGLDARNFSRDFKCSSTDASVGPDDVDQIILMGSSMRIPRIQALMREYFGGREPNKGINPDKSVAVGAAIQGSILSREGGDDVRDLMLLDMMPLSLDTNANGWR